MSSYTSSFSTTDATKIPGVLSNQNDALGGTTSAKLPDGSSVQCTKQIADGTVDILINIANNKGHTLFGGSTLCMRTTSAHSRPTTTTSPLRLQHQQERRHLGGNPVRQQLCFIDSCSRTRRRTAARLRPRQATSSWERSRRRSIT